MVLPSPISSPMMPPALWVCSSHSHLTPAEVGHTPHCRIYITLHPKYSSSHGHLTPAEKGYTPHSWTPDYLYTGSLTLLVPSSKNVMIHQHDFESSSQSDYLYTCYSSMQTDRHWRRHRQDMTARSKTCSMYVLRSLQYGNWLCVLICHFVSKSCGLY